MVPANPPQERRALSRFSVTGFAVDIRIQGRLARLRAEAVDFNRHGMAVLTETPLKERKNVYLTLRVGDDLRLDNLHGVVHNCCTHEGRFRCGIRFRTHTALQTDKALVEAVLTRMEGVAMSQEAQTLTGDHPLVTTGRG